MKLIYFTAMLSCFLFSANAQKLQRAFAFGNTSEEYGRKIAYDANGNMFVAGSFRGNNMDVDPSGGTFNLSSNGDWDFYIAKYDPYGIFLNAIRVGGALNDQATSIAVDNSGAVYITGWFRGTVDFDPGSGTSNVVSNGHSGNDMGYNGEVFLAKYTNNLTYSWAFGIGGSYIDDAGLAVKIDKQGDVVLAGNFRGLNIDFDPSASTANLSAAGVIESFIAKYTAAGNYVWAKGIGGASTVSGQVRDLAIDNNNNIFAVGHFDGSVDLNPGPATNNVVSSGCGDIYLLKLSAAGEYKWGFKMGGANCDYPVSIVVDNNANAYISGYFSSSVDFNPGSGVNTLTSSGGYDIFLAKYDSTGGHMFAKKAGGPASDIGYDMALRSDGLVLVGYFTNTVDFDPSAATNALTSASDSSDGFIAHYTFDGQYVSAFKLGSTGEDAVYAVYADSNDVISVSGFFNRSNVDFDPSSGKFYLTNTGNNKDVFVAKYYDLDVRNTLKGSVFIDKDGDGTKDNDETYFPGAKIISVKQGEDTVITISPNGRFAFGIDTGSYVTTPVLPVPYYTITPASDTTNFSTYMNSDSVSFAVQPIPGIKDLKVTVIPLSPTRPGFRSFYKIIYLNKGTDTIPVAGVQFVRDNRLIFDSASVVPTSVSGDTLNWTFNNVAPRTFGSIILYLKGSTPPTLNFGDTLVSVATINPVVTDSTPVDNVFSLKQITVGSYDPNDKRENHGGRITTTQIADGDFLQYTIRFQNTGTDTAFNINVRDTLSTKLEWSTLEMVSASHDYQFLLTDGNKCLWTFSNINLVDSNTNEPMSHGYISFRVKPKTSLVVGDIINNKASIYFDFNLPVVTNVEQTTVMATSVLPLTLLNFSAVRSGKINQLTWKTVNEVNVSHFDVQRSHNGKDFVTIGKVGAQSAATAERNYSFTDDFPIKAANFYRLLIVDKDGKQQFSLIRKVDNSLGISFEFHPNPVRSKLVISIYAEEAQEIQVEIVDLNGKLQSQSPMNVINGQMSVELNVSQLAAGLYFVRVSNSKEQITQKFIKL